MPVRGSNLVEEAERRKENILQKIKAVNVKPFDNNILTENQDENSYQENDEEIRQNSIKVGFLKIVPRGNCNLNCCLEMGRFQTGNFEMSRFLCSELLRSTVLTMQIYSGGQLR